MSPSSPSADSAPLPGDTGTASRSAAAGFLLGRIDYERTPPSGNSAGTFRLARMQDLLQRLGNPHLEVPCVHIAGSKGKGSTAAMTAAILTAAGHRTGLFTSPHIERFEERIQIDGVPIPSERFAELVEQLRPVAEEMDPGPLGGPTFFELTTALAWLHFVTEQVDVVVLEVGLGGRLDATNLCRPLVTIVTSISRDHTKILGESLAEIASEKAGIAKPRVPMLTAVSAAEPLAVIRERAAAVDAACHVVGEGIDVAFHETTPEGSAGAVFPSVSIDLDTPWRNHQQVKVPLPGRHQAWNTALAVGTVDLLDATGALCVTKSAIRDGLAAVRWPLRIEVIGRDPLLVVDAAHNEASITALVESLRDVSAVRRIAIVAISKDKDATTMLRYLGAGFDDLILTRFLGNPRAIAVEDLRRLCGDDMTCHLHRAAGPAEALTFARSLATPADLICATGSFFLAGEIRGIAVNV